jgi:dTMP kinase
MFISMEGGEGCGKTTQVKKFCTWLTMLGHEVVQTREPGGMGSPLAESIRAMLLNPANVIDHRAEVLLFLAARAQHLHDVIIPALAANKIVVTDRFHDSTFCYQHYARNAVSAQEFNTMNAWL